MQTVVALKDLFSAAGRQDPYPFYADLHRQGQAAPLDPAVDPYSVVVRGWEAVEQFRRGPAFRIRDGAYPDQLGPPAEPLWRRRLSLWVLKQSASIPNPPDHM